MSLPLTYKLNYLIHQISENDVAYNTITVIRNIKIMVSIGKSLFTLYTEKVIQV